MSPDSSFFGPLQPDAHPANPVHISAQENSALASAQVRTVRKPAPTPSYTQQCAALALYRQTVARYLADVDAVEGDPCFWTAMGERAGRANG